MALLTAAEKLISAWRVPTGQTHRDAISRPGLRSCTPLSFGSRMTGRSPRDRRRRCPDERGHHGGHDFGPGGWWQPAEEAAAPAPRPGPGAWPTWPPPARPGVPCRHRHCRRHGQQPRRSTHERPTRQRRNGRSRCQRPRSRTMAGGRRRRPARRRRPPRRRCPPPSASASRPDGERRPITSSATGRRWAGPSSPSGSTGSTSSTSSSAGCGITTPAGSSSWTRPPPWRGNRPGGRACSRKWPRPSSGPPVTWRCCAR